MRIKCIYVSCASHSSIGWNHIDAVANDSRKGFLMIIIWRGFSGINNILSRRLEAVAPRLF